MYSLEGYGKMASDRLRSEAYLAALGRTVRQGSVVVDLGCGPGMFALHACRLGARKVYAIEPGDSIQIARDLAQANGFSDRIECIQALSAEVTLPEPADVIVADLRGILPFYGQSLSSMIDARQRFLAPGGVVIPQSDRVWGALLQAPETYQRSVLSWETALHGFDRSVIQALTANSIYKIRTSPDEYLAAPAPIAAINYQSTDSSLCRGKGLWTVSHDGTAHGLGLWFDTVLAEGAVFSNAPDRPELLYGVAFFPFQQPLPVRAGDELHVQIDADPVGADYIWRWNSTLNGRSRFEQSTFFGMPLSADSLRRISYL